MISFLISSSSAHQKWFLWPVFLPFNIKCLVIAEMKHFTFCRGWIGECPGLAYLSIFPVFLLKEERVYQGIMTKLTFGGFCAALQVSRVNWWQGCPHEASLASSSWSIFSSWKMLDLTSLLIDNILCQSQESSILLFYFLFQVDPGCPKAPSGIYIFFFFPKTVIGLQSC